MVEISVYAGFKGGWTRVEGPDFLSREHSIDIRDWLEENSTDEYLKYGRTYFFKNAQDASFFLLRWS
jgi:ABC-type uncharacterized transport system fused permease/ATPase subunit